MRAKKEGRAWLKGEPLTPEEERQAERDWFEAQMPARKVMGGKKEPKTPPAPEWLPQFVPGLTAGKPIEKLPTKTPSGQTWSMLPPSTQLGLAGYVDWAGDRTFEDVYEQMQIMKPKTPRGAGVEQWRPASQRA